MTKKVTLTGIFVSLFFVTFFFSNLIFNLNKPISTNGDFALSYFVQQNNLTKFATLDFGNVFYTRMFYSLKNTLAFGNANFPMSIVSLPVFFMTRNVFLSSNTGILITFFLSFLCMYFFAYHISKSVSGSLIAGLVYSYNPFVMAHLSQFESITLYLIPIVFLATEKMLGKGKWYWIIILVGAFALNVTASFYYAFFLLVIWPIYTSLRVIMLKISPKIFLRPSFLISLVVGIFLVGVFLTPYFEIQSKYHVHRGLGELINLSAKPKDFLFTSKQNILYGKFVQNMYFWQFRDPFAALHPTEHSLFPGATVVLLMLITIYLYIFRKTDNKHKSIFLASCICLIAAIALSFGPEYFPYFILYKFVPFADALRVPARFMVLGYLFVSVILAIGWGNFSTKKGTLKLVLTGIIILSIIFEYRHYIPTSPNTPSYILSFYSKLSQQKNVKVIAEIPMAGGFRTPSDDGIYLFYALFHNKYIINGYSGFIPPENQILGEDLAFNFPSKQTIHELKNRGIDEVVVHEEELPDPAMGKTLVSRMEKLGLKQSFSVGPVHAFLIK